MRNDELMRQEAVVGFVSHRLSGVLHAVVPPFLDQFLNQQSDRVKRLRLVH